MKTSISMCAVFVFAACTSSYKVSHNPRPGEYSYAQLNEIAEDKSLTVLTVSGEKMKVKELEVKADSATFRHAVGGRKGTIATSSVRSVTVRKTNQGVLYGALVGSAAGAAVGLSIVDEVSKGISLDYRGYFVLVGLPVGGGAILGLLVGSALAPSDEYVVSHDK